MPRPVKRSQATTRNSSSAYVLRSNTKLAIEATTSSQVAKPTHHLAARRKRGPNADPWTKKRKPNPNPKPRKVHTHFTCRICIEEKTTDEFVQWLPMKRRRWGNTDVPPNCIAHLARDPSKRKIDPVCKSCVSNSMSAVLDTLGARQVSRGCLEPGCTQTWDHQYIVRYMPGGAPLEKYNLEMFQVWKNTADPGPMTCPSPGCNAIGLPDEQAAGYPQVVCNACSFRSCAQCRVPWHKDVTCAEYAAKHVDEEMSDVEKYTLEIMQSKDAKRCPHCQLVIEKDGGCNSMVRHRVSCP